MEIGLVVVVVMMILVLVLECTYSTRRVEHAFAARRENACPIARLGIQLVEGGVLHS